MKEVVKPIYSIIVPVYNEEESLSYCLSRLIDVMNSQKESYEIIFVNDGSKDKSISILQEFAQKYSFVKVIDFSRNFGQQISLQAGFEHAKGDAVINIDCDLQDPPEAILDMIKKWKEGYEIVLGIRKKRKGESFLKKFTSNIFNKLMSKLTNSSIRCSGEFRLLDRKVINVLTKQMPEQTRYLRCSTSWVGFNQTCVYFERDERKYGKTKYNFKKLVKTASMGLFGFTNFPIIAILKTSLFLGVVSLLNALTFLVLEICSIHLGLYWLFPFILFLTAGMLGAISIVGIYITKIYDEVKHRPLYIINNLYNLESENNEQN